jgi:hypothetical protein
VANFFHAGLGQVRRAHALQLDYGACS